MNQTNNSKEWLIVAGGFQPAYVRDITSAVSELGLGHKVCLLGSDKHANVEYADNVHFINIRGNDSPNRSVIEKVKDLICFYTKLIIFIYRSNSPIVHYVSIFRPIEYIMINVILKLLGKRIIHTAHNILPHDRYNLTNRILFNIIYNYISDYIVVHGQSLQNTLIREFHVEKNKIVIVPHGVYTIRSKSLFSKAKARTFLGIKDHEFVLLAFGQQNFYKGTHLLLDALAQNILPNIKLLIRGKSLKPDYGKRLTKKINELNLTSFVDCELGFVPDEDIEIYFKAADVVVLPYLEGSESGVKYMAYAYGRPVLVSNVGSLPEHIVQGVTGEVYEAGNQTILLETIKKMQQNNHKYNELNIKQITSKQNSWQLCAQLIYEHVKKIVND